MTTHSDQEGRFICSTISPQNGTNLGIGYDNDWSHRKEFEFYSDNASGKAHAFESEKDKEKKLKKEKAKEAQTEKDKDKNEKESKNENKSKANESKEEESYKKQKCAIENFYLPIINVRCDKWVIETGPDGDSYTAYELVYVKLTNDNETPSRLGATLSRFRKLNAFNDSFLKFLKEQDKKEIADKLKSIFPKKLYFWTTEDDKLRDSRSDAFSKYMDLCCSDEYLSHATLFQEFFHLRGMLCRIVIEDDMYFDSISVFVFCFFHICQPMGFRIFILVYQTLVFLLF